MLEDGTVFEGVSFGAEGERSGEVVFNTSMTGYQEVLTDPSYAGQIVVMTQPHIGNTGVNEEDMESSRPWLEGFAVRSASPLASSHRSRASLGDFLKGHRIVGIAEIDTRAITKKLRTVGAMRGLISTDLQEEGLRRKVQAVPRLEEQDWVRKVTIPRKVVWKEENASPWFHSLDAFKGDRIFRVAALDFGTKWNIFRSLASCGCEVTVFPAATPPEEILEHRPDGIFLSNGPGDPKQAGYAVETVKQLIGKAPVFGICLGHQIIGLAMGLDTHRLKFGHRGANHPVRRVATGQVEITTQNHGFTVDDRQAEARGMEVTHRSLNDGSVEGLRHKELPLFSVQYHPEASAGPHDSKYLFSEFLRLMDAS
jgi:carbamoyl-phosphate synthase small subunit